MNKIYEEEANIEKLEDKIGKKILFKMQDSFHPETYEIE